MLREVAEGIDAQSSFSGTLVVTVGAVLVAIVGKITIGNGYVQSKFHKRPEPPEPEHAAGPTRTPLEVDLMKQRSALEAKVKAKDQIIEMQDSEITRLRDMCWSNHINPNISSRFTGGTDDDGTTQA